jgi:CRP-like cAMP-binding protein
MHPGHTRRRGIGRGQMLAPAVRGRFAPDQAGCRPVRARCLRRRLGGQPLRQLKPARGLPAARRRTREIGSYLGLSAESVSRLFMRLQERAS